MTIDSGDTEDRFMAPAPAPHFIGFTSDGGEVGRLWFGPPMRFEGDAEEGARVFFEYVVDKDCKAQMALRLLKHAKCPDADCDGDGVCSKLAPGYDGESDVDIWECQWCAERNVALGVT